MLEPTTPPKYKLVEREGFHEDHWCVEILEGDYKGLVYQYDTVRFGDEDESGESTLTYNTITVDNPNNCDLTLENDKGIMGSILVEIIKEQLEHMSENGTPDSEEPAK